MQKHPSKRRAQAAMEFLMTYGWAILVVLIVIAALAYFGVLDPSNVLPDKCTIGIEFTCSDFAVTSNDVRLTLVNSGGRDVSVQSVLITGASLAPTANAPCINASTTPGQLNQTVVQGAERTFVVNCAQTATGKSKDKYDLLINYTYLGSTLVHTAKGQLLTKRVG